MSTTPNAVHPRRPVRTIVWTAVWLSVAFTGTILLSTVEDPDGNPWLEGSVIGQTLTTLGVVGAAVLPSLLGTRKDAAIAREQLQNSHKTNLRDDQDAHRRENKEDFSRLSEAVFGLASDIRGMRADIGRHSDQFIDVQKQLHDLGKEVRASNRTAQRALEQATLNTGAIQKILSPHEEENHD